MHEATPTWIYAACAVLVQVVAMVRGFVLLERRLTRIEGHLERHSESFAEHRADDKEQFGGINERLRGLELSREHNRR